MNQHRRALARLSLDPANERIYQGQRVLALTPKAFAVLRHLMERPDRLAAKDELLAAIWPDTIVTEASLTTAIREIRRALGDTPEAPRYVETVHRRGYRLVGATLHPTLAVGTSRTAPSAGRLVGRERELSALAQSLRQVKEGAQRVVLVAGEAGIGKTALVDHFVAEIADLPGAQVGRGQCVEPYGACEAYLPWLDALNHLARHIGPRRLTRLLRRYAPMWLAQLPWLIDAGERSRLSREIAGATPERMIRELGEALEALCADGPLMMVLEDLHWSDPSSIGVLAYMGRRRQPGRLMLLGTYRPADLHVPSHPLMAVKQELLLHGACEELSLDFLTPDAVSEYVMSRVPGAPADLAAEVHRRTDGNPLFMVNVVDDLVARGALVQQGERWQLRDDRPIPSTEVPESLKEMIERQLDGLAPDDRRVLEAASVAGAVFSGAAVAAALEASIESTEECLGTLARRGSFVRATERQTWPDGTESDGYGFVHALYQQVLYERIGTARRSRLHRQAGERLERGYGDQAGEIAAQLALHFQRGRDPKRAVCYFALAGENAIRRGANVEAIAILNQGISLLSSLPDQADRDACELQLRVPLGVCYINTRGFAAPEVGGTFERAQALCRHVSDTSRRCRVLRGLWSFALHRADLQRARAVAEELLHLAEREGHPSGLLEGHRILAPTWFSMGDFSRALDHSERGFALYDAKHHASHTLLYGQDPGVCCLAWQAWAHWYLGSPDRAVTAAMRAIELARRIGHPFTLSFAMNFAALVYVWRGEPLAAARWAREAVAQAHEQGLTTMLAVGQVLHGWSETFLGRGDSAIAELREGVARWHASGARLATPFWMHLHASALDRIGRRADALETLDDALARVEHMDQPWFACELSILKATLTVREGHRNRHGSARTDAYRDLRRAFDIATEMESPSLRLRAANALSPLLRDQGKTAEARDLVRAAYTPFNEGFESADLAEAQAILARP